MYSITLSLSNPVLEFSSSNCVFADQSSLGFFPPLIYAYFFIPSFFNSFLGLILQAAAGIVVQSLL